MKFMKLGSKPDTFQTDGNNVRSVASDLASDIIVTVGDTKFHLHKFPLLSKSAHLQKFVTTTTSNLNTENEVQISEIPGGAIAFEICAKFCYGITVTLNAYNVIVVRCAAEYLGMHETVEKGNLIYKIDVFLSSGIFHSWKDSIIVLQTSNPMLPLAEDLRIVSHCIESISSKVCLDVSKVDWSYTYNRLKLPHQNGIDPNQTEGSRTRHVPKDWWVEDLCELEVDLYKSVMINVTNKKVHSSEVIGEALRAYADRRLLNFNKGMSMIHHREVSKHRLIAETIVLLLPSEKGSVACRFLLKLLKAATLLDLGDMAKDELVRRIGRQLEEASAADILVQAPDKEATMYNVNVVQKIVKEFLMQDQSSEIESARNSGLKEITRPGILSDASKLMVAKLVDKYLAEISKDPNLPLSKFVDLAELVSGLSRPTHDGLYKAIDMYLKEHPGISKEERNRICKLMDCKKLSIDACMHVVQNERLPMRVVVQVLYYEQVRTCATSGTSTPNMLKGTIKYLNSESYSGSRSVAVSNTENDSAEELKALRKELASLSLTNRDKHGDSNNNNNEPSTENAVMSKMKVLFKSKGSFIRPWASKMGVRENNISSDSFKSNGSAIPEEAKSTRSRNRRHSVS